MKESLLNRLSAERATTAQLIDEVNRLLHALERQDTEPKQARRYQARLVIYRNELATRIHLSEKLKN